MFEAVVNCLLKNEHKVSALMTCHDHFAQIAAFPLYDKFHPGTLTDLFTEETQTSHDFKKRIAPRVHNPNKIPHASTKLLDLCLHVVNEFFEFGYACSFHSHAFSEQREDSDLISRIVV